MRSSPQNTLDTQAQFLLSKLFPEYNNLRKIHQGSFSTVFYFTTKGQERIIKIGIENPINLRLSAQEFENTHIPVPKVYTLGKIEKLHFSVLDYCPGGELQFTEITKSLPSIIQTLFQVHCHPLPYQQPIIRKFQYPTQILKITNWAEYLSIFVGVEKNYILKATAHESFKSIYSDLIQQLSERLPYCEHIIYRIHGDLNCYNICTQNHIVTGLIDWADLKYGDFLYDYTWLLLLSSKDDLFSHSQSIYHYYRNNGMDVKNYSQRLQLCLIHKAILLMAFNLYLSNNKKYLQVRNNIQLCLNTPEKLIRQ